VVQISLFRPFLRLGVVLVGMFTLANPSSAQLRVVTYNTANGSFPGNNIFPRTGMDTVLEAIGDEVVNGIAKPIDVLILQEQDEPTTTSQAFVDILDGLYGSGTYAAFSLQSGPGGTSIRQTMVVNIQTVTGLGQVAFGATGISAAARETARFHIRPAGYDSSADLYVYNDHYKAGSSCCGTTSDQARRNFEAQTVRVDSDFLGQGTHAIYAGDYNIQSSTEAMYQTLLAAGNGQAFDPINMPGSWNHAPSFAAIHTQSPHDGSDGLTTGGMDDRFDFQLVTEELLDGEGLSYIGGSYHAFGNDGVSYNQAINNTFVGRSQSASVLNALAHVSDHLPVVADYQIPASMDVQVDTIPATVNLGDTVNIDVMIENIADVVAALGADELDYSLSVTGDLSGNASGSILALAGSDIQQISFDTSSVGMRSGTLTVSSSSQAVANGLFSLPISFEVLSAFLEADFNEDGDVDATDLAAWESGLGLTGSATKAQGDANGDQDVNGADFAIWQQQLGQSTNLAASTHTVPEPRTGTYVCLTIIATVLSSRVSRRRASEKWCFSIRPEG